VFQRLFDDRIAREEKLRLVRSKFEGDERSKWSKVVEAHHSSKLKNLIRKDPKTGQLFINVLELVKPFAEGIVSLEEANADLFTDESVEHIRELG